MCLAVYLSSDEPIQLIPWNATTPSFYISEPTRTARVVQRHLTKPYLAVVGTQTGCGCGFLADGVPGGTPEYVELRATYQKLVEYLHSAFPGQIVEIYTCWGGEEGSDPGCRRRVELKDLEADDFTFREGELLTVEITK